MLIINVLVLYYMVNTCAAYSLYIVYWIEFCRLVDYYSVV